MLVPIEKIKVPITLNKRLINKKMKKYIKYFNENKYLPPLILNESYEIKHGRTRYQAALN